MIIRVTRLIILFVQLGMFKLRLPLKNLYVKGLTIAEKLVIMGLHVVPLG